MQNYVNTNPMDILSRTDRRIIMIDNNIVEKMRNADIFAAVAPGATNSMGSVWWILLHLLGFTCLRALLIALVMPHLQIRNLAIRRRRNLIITCRWRELRTQQYHSF